MAQITNQQLHRTLDHFFGFTSFRPLQEEIVTAITNGQDCLAILPTGGGKSLCFQLPGLVLPGITLVISPLISLMTDQVENLSKKGVRAVALNSSLSQSEQAQAVQDIQLLLYKFVYLSPEKLASEQIQAVLSKLPIRLLVIDEAHCISEWGHQFRPEYRQIKQCIQQLSSPPIVAAFTATATPQTAADIRQQLGLRSPAEFRQSVIRSNLSLHILDCPTKTIQNLVCQRLLYRHQQSACIIYCATREQTELTASFLCQQGIEAVPYHAGLTSDRRQHVQHQFIANRYQVICATTAFGMGVDKPDIRCVIHLNIPVSIEGYYQEIGRAGRDGQPSSCYLLSLPGDAALQTEIIERGYPPVLLIEQLLQVMIAARLQPTQYLSFATLITPLVDSPDRYKFRFILESGATQGWWSIDDVGRQIRLNVAVPVIFQQWQLLVRQQLRQLNKLKMMTTFLRTPRCRMKQLVEYFEPPSRHAQFARFSCRQCDRCRPSRIGLPTENELRRFQKVNRLVTKVYPQPRLAQLCTQLISTYTTLYSQPKHVPGIGRGWRETIGQRLDRADHQ